MLIMKLTFPLAFLVIEFGFTIADENLDYLSQAEALIEEIEQEFQVLSSMVRSQNLRGFFRQGNSDPENPRVNFEPGISRKLLF